MVMLIPLCLCFVHWDLLREQNSRGAPATTPLILSDGEPDEADGDSDVGPRQLP